MSINLFNVHDMSNAYIDISGLTKPSDFVNSDVTQNKPDTTSSSLIMNINNSQHENSVTIKNYVIDVSGNNGTNATSTTRTLVPTTKTAHSTNTDVTLSDLSANTVYDLSAHLINLYDMSNNKLVARGVTRPRDFESGNISQVIGTTTQSTLMIQVSNNQVAGTLNINKYMVDVSGNNGTNATKQTKTKTPALQLPTSTNSDVNLTDLSANTYYDLSVNMFNVEDMSSNKIAAGGATRPSEFATNGKDVSQNMVSSNVTINKIVMNVKHKDVVNTLDISKNTIKYSARGNNDSNTITKTATIKSSHLSNYDISINNLQYPNSVYDMSINLFNVHDMSNAYIDISGLTKPSDFVNSDVTQNKPDTTSSSLIMNINNSQHENSVTIKNYVIDVSGNNGSNASKLTRTLVPTTKTSHSTNTDVTLSDLSANTVYDLSAHLINLYDMSNNKLVNRGVTRPRDFESGNISQVIGTTTQSTLMMKVSNNQVTGTLNINKYTVDVSGNNGTNATKQTKTKTPVLQLATSTNSDVSLNDLSANTLYDLSINMFNVEDMSSNKIVASGVTRPSEFITNGKDVSQNMVSSNVTINKIVMNVKHKDVAGTLDISGYTIKYSARGNNDSNTITKTATVKSAHLSNYDISINNLQYPNSVYDMSINLFNVHDMSNAYIDISGLTKPSDFVSSDVTQNKPDTTSSSLIMNINNSQHENSVTIKNYVIDVSGNNGTNATSSTRTLVPTTKTAHSTNTDVTLSDLSSNTVYDLSAHLINLYDMSNNKLVARGVTRPRDFESGNISQVIGTTTQSTLMMQVSNNQVTGTLNINKYMIDVSGNNGANATKQTKTKTPVLQLDYIY